MQSAGSVRGAILYLMDKSPKIPSTSSSAAWISVLLLIFFPNIAGALDSTLNKNQNYSLNTGSFIFHLYEPRGHFTQYFQNQYLAVERRIDDSIVDNIVLGTVVNSYGNRCAVLGVQKNWVEFSDRTTFEGIYAYTGEFFFQAFSECGSEGYYHKIEKATGIGFAPYIYHGIEYDLNPYASIEYGIILPGILVLSLQWHF